MGNKLIIDVNQNASVFGTIAVKSKFEAETVSEHRITRSSANVLMYTDIFLSFLHDLPNK